MTKEQPADSTPPKRGASAHRAAEALRTAIVSGHLRAGEAVRETDWADRLKMSRTPVRDAVNRLVTEGVLVKKNRQAFVFQPSLADLVEIYEIRLALERQALVFAVAEASDDDLAAVMDDLRQLEAADETAEWFELHEKFHMRMLQLSGRVRLTKLIRTLRLQSEPYVRLAINADPKFRAQSLYDHVNLADALVAHDSDVIDKLAERHLNATCDELRRLLALRIDIQGMVTLMSG